MLKSLYKSYICFVLLWLFCVFFLGCEFSVNFSSTNPNPNNQPIQYSPQKEIPGHQTNIYTAVQKNDEQPIQSIPKAQIDIEKIGIKDICDYFFPGKNNQYCVNFFNQSKIKE